MSRRASYSYRPSAAMRAARRVQQLQDLLASLNAALRTAEAALSNPVVRVHVEEDLVRLRHRQREFAAASQFSDLTNASAIRSAIYEVNSLPVRARTMHLMVEERERKRREELGRMRREAESEMEQFRLELVMSISDAVVLDFALPGIVALRVDAPASPAECAAARQHLAASFASICADAREKAQRWRDEQKSAIHEGEAAMISEQKARIANLAPGAANDAVDLGAALSAIEQRAAAGEIGSEQLVSEIAGIACQLDAHEEGEDIRRVVVEALMQLLDDAGFLVEPPQRYQDAGDIVRIIARRPSGSEAEFAIGLDGMMTYTFDNYDGQECRVDIDDVVPKLNEIYGIDLGDERILWENPDRISRSARPLDDRNGGQHHG